MLIHCMFIRCILIKMSDFSAQWTMLVVWILLFQQMSLSVKTRLKTIDCNGVFQCKKTNRTYKIIYILSLRYVSYDGCCFVVVVNSRHWFLPSFKSIQLIATFIWHHVICCDFYFKYTFLKVTDWYLILNHVINYHGHLTSRWLLPSFQMVSLITTFI